MVLPARVRAVAAKLRLVYRYTHTLATRVEKKRFSQSLVAEESILLLPCSCLSSKGHTSLAFLGIQKASGRSSCTLLFVPICFSSRQKCVDGQISQDLGGADHNAMMQIAKPSPRRRAPCERQPLLTTGGERSAPLSFAQLGTAGHNTTPLRLFTEST